MRNTKKSLKYSSPFLEEHKHLNYKVESDKDTISKTLEKIIKEKNYFSSFNVDCSSKYLKGILSLYKIHKQRKLTRVQIKLMLIDYFSRNNIPFAFECLSRYVNNALEKCIHKGYLIKIKYHTFKRTSRKFEEYSSSDIYLNPILIVYNNKDHIIHISEKHYNYLFCLELDENGKLVYRTFDINNISLFSVLE